MGRHGGYTWRAARPEIGDRFDGDGHDLAAGEVGMIATLAFPALTALASSGPGDAVGTCFVLFVLPGVQALVCWLVVNCFNVIPRKYHLQDPNMTWLLLVPFFNLYWNFKVYPALAESYQAFFYSHGIADVGDCGQALARWYCICALLWFIPCAAWIASLALLIVFLIRAHELRDRIPAVERAA